MITSLAPGFVASYDAARRTVRVIIPGITDGAEALPEAQINYPIGDKSEHTEIRILPGDRVWLAFVNGDPRYPVVVGYRPKQTGNAIGWRKFHHENIELNANLEVHIIGGSKVTVTSPEVLIDTALATVTGTLVVENGLSVTGNNGSGHAVSIAGNTNFTGTVTANGKTIDETHRHGGVQAGGSNTGTVT